MKKILLQEQQERNPSQIMVLYVSKWEKDSNGLYDYQARLMKQRFQIYQSCKIFRNLITGKTKVVTLEQIKKGLTPSPQYLFIGSINKFKDKFKFINPIQQKLNESQNDQNLSVFRSIRYTNLPIQYRLNQGDIIKIGKLTFSVMEISSKKQRKTSNKNFKQKQQQNSISHKFLSQKQVHYQVKDREGHCKICLSDEIEQNNFLVSPCLCKGSCQLVHLQCLKLWILSKTKKQVEGIVSTYNFTKFECQICKTNFPKLIIYKNKSYNMLTIDKPNSQYIILQATQNDKQNSIHIIASKQNKKITIGRGNQNILRLNDVSVSRSHAQINIIKGQYFLSDLQSKFGTLVKVNKQIQIQHESILQCGRYLYSFKNQNYKYTKSNGMILY